MEPPPLKTFASPAMPLFPLSPERVNSARPLNGALPHSPSLPEFSAKGVLDPSLIFTSTPSPSAHRHTRHNSEALVHGMVARFDTLSIKGLPATG